ncbi:transglutaminase [Arthrobacter sp. MYb211]|uniref:transglutaminase-like domain-containing protein n=1 Tax=unclassified Arthrobacter TaxID=235627 RepID=UPI000CFE02DE|nr:MULTISPECIES: transglutaminase-like domain-containing protein [unclassified Arthrobacter]PRA13450.1 transglutaminase [Arthrobacter sp. MYb221]PRC10648.1 transglutaminase [Arthrobacter sp. MYb211]
MSQKLSLARYGIDAACIGVALLLGALGLWDAYGGSMHFMLACLSGIIAGLALAWANVWFRLGTWQTLAWLAGIYLILGTVMATPREALFGMIPTLESVRILLAGVVLSWKDMLTVAPPVGEFGGMLIVAFLTTLLTALLAGLAAWHLRSPFYTLLPVLAMFVIGIVFGTREVPVPVLRGSAFIALLVGWLAWRRYMGTKLKDGFRSLNHGEEETHSAQLALLRRVALGVVVLLGAAAVTAAAAPLLSPQTPRQVLRDALEPPVDLYDFPSPLTRFRKYVKTMADDTMLTVKGLPEGERIRLAALDSYNGMVFNVDPKSGGNFSPVGDSSDIRATGSLDGRANGVLDIEINDYNGVWLPAGGRLTGIELTGERKDELARTLFYSEQAETALSSIGLHEGDAYTAHVQFPGHPSDEQLAQLDFAELRMPDLANVPALAAARSADFVGSGTGDANRARSLETSLNNSGFFSNGAEGQVPSLSGHGAGRITNLLDAEQMIGDDEQYAAAMALMAREQGIPARVVMGFYPEEYDEAQAIKLTGSDVHAWVEIAFEGVGWVPFNPTPDEDEQPTPPEQEPKAVPQPQVLQPPPPGQDEAKLPPETAPEPQEVEEELETFWERFGTLIIITAVSLGSLLVLLSPLLLILALKIRRRKRRANQGNLGERVSGGWQEVLSHATDLRVLTAAGATRKENAKILAEGFPKLRRQSLALAEKADRATFSREVPNAQEVTDYWLAVDEQTEAMRSTATYWQQLRAKFSPRSLIHELVGTLARSGMRSERKNQTVGIVNPHQSKE